MTAVYTKDGLTVHFSAAKPAAIELIIKSLLSTAILAVEGSDIMGLTESDTSAICDVVRLAHDMLPMEKDFELMMNNKSNSLKDVAKSLLA
jgi:hypothetical protein